jgi:hypothetical protein
MDEKKKRNRPKLQERFKVKLAYKYQYDESIYIVVLQKEKVIG